MPCAEYIFMMCHRIGLAPISIIGLGLRCVSSEIRVPSPPARITAFIPVSSGSWPRDRSLARRVRGQCGPRDEFLRGLAGELDADADGSAERRCAELAQRRVALAVGAQD